MSVGEKAFGLIKTALTYQERMDGLSDRIEAIATDLVRLSESHAALRDRVSRIEGMIEGAAMARQSPRLEG